MANFANVANYLESAIATQLNATRQTQDVWEWYNALQRLMSQNRFTGTPTVYGPVGSTATTGAPISTAASSLFGCIIDNSQSAEDVLYGLYNTSSVTGGTTNTLGILWAARSTMACYVMSYPIAFSSKIYGLSMLGTEAGIEAGTDSTTQPTVLFVYTV